MNLFPTNIFSDYDAPLTEAGHYTPKYDRAAEMIAAYDILSEDLVKPERPEIVPPTIYQTVIMDEYLDFETIVSNVVSVTVKKITFSYLKYDIFSQKNKYLK